MEETSAPSYWIEEFKVSKLWGRRDVSLSFNDNVNIIVGPNASGKTTLLNLLRFIITVDLDGLHKIQFTEAVLYLHSFGGQSTRTIRIKKQETGVTYRISNRTYTLDYGDARAFWVNETFTSRRRFRLRERQVEPIRSDVIMTMERLVSAVWLPVSRRLPIDPFSESQRRDSDTDVESVDVRLRELLANLTTYRLALNLSLSERHSKFEKDVLKTILYHKEHDTLMIGPGEKPTDQDKTQLLTAFEAAGLLDTAMKSRINEHFDAANETYDRIMKDTQDTDKPVLMEDVVIVPLIRRTRRIVDFARELEVFREDLFRPVRKFESTLNSFLSGKEVSITDKGQAEIRSTQFDTEIDPMLLSSGEKQLMILLIQALLWEDKPVVYVVDEPELSLHVEWQGKLLTGLVELARSIQLIVATHAPEIVGGFRDKVIRLSLE